MRKTISVIVPIFNEEKTVAGVVESLLGSGLIDEIVCVNDGSTDRSLAILKGFEGKIEIIDLKKNYGKGAALVEGIKRAQGEIVAFFDADFTNLSNGHIETLLNPVLENKARVVLGYIKNGYLPNIFSHLTGQRAYYKRDLIPHLEKMAETRLGVETFLNSLFNEKETKKTPLKKLIHLYKYEKYSPTEAFKKYLEEAAEVAQELGKRELLSPEDYKIIEKLAETTSFKELKAKVSEISNKRVKQFLDKYVLKYIKKAQGWWKKV